MKNITKRKGKNNEKTMENNVKRNEIVLNFPFDLINFCIFFHIIFFILVSFSQCDFCSFPLIIFFWFALTVESFLSHLLMPTRAAGHDEHGGFHHEMDEDFEKNLHFERLVEDFYELELESFGVQFNFQLKVLFSQFIEFGNFFFQLK